MSASKSSGKSHQRPVIINRSDYKKIPLDIRELGDDVREIAENVYSGDILSIDWHGSIPRGDFVFGESDADITIFIGHNFESGHREKREKLLRDILPKWRNRGICKLDVIAVPKPEFHKDARRNGLFFTESDGIFLPGFPRLDFSYTLPKTNLELVEILNRYFKLWILDARNNIPELTKSQIYQQVWKRTYRAIYGLAILDGAPYEQNWRSYPKFIKEYTPQYTETIQQLLYEKAVPLDTIIEIGKNTYEQLEKFGIKFMTNWN